MGIIPPKTPDVDKSYSTSLDEWQQKTRCECGFRVLLWTLLD